VEAQARKSAPRVLVVEGRGELREALKESLGSTFSVSTARSAEGALGGIESYRPRAVLVCEDQTGEMSGLDLADELRGSEITRDCLLIVYGGGSIDAARAKERHGIDEYLGPDVTLSQLDELLCKHLRVGWTRMSQTEAEAGDTDRFHHPMTEGRVMSARKNGADSGTKKTKKKGFFSRLFGS
jgi:DNA-binding NtrC family response regulator